MQMLQSDWLSYSYTVSHYNVVAARRQRNGDRAFLRFPDVLVAFYADALWARHVIFRPHERLPKPTAHSFPLVCARPDPGCGLCSAVVGDRAHDGKVFWFS